MREMREREMERKSERTKPYSPTTHHPNPNSTALQATNPLLPTASALPELFNCPPLLVLPPKTVPAPPRPLLVSRAAGLTVADP